MSRVRGGVTGAAAVKRTLAQTEDVTWQSDIVTWQGQTVNWTD